MNSKTPKVANLVSVQGSDQYIKVTRNLRWTVIALTLLSWSLIDGQSLAALWQFAALAVLYNLVMHLRSASQHKWLTARPAILLIDSSLILLLLILSSGKFASPYTSLLMFPIISSAYWYGIRVSVLIGATQFVVGCLLLSPLTPSDQLANNIVDFGIRIMAFVLISGYIAHLTRSDRNSRWDFANKDFQINQERQQLLAMINNINDAVIIVNQDGKIGLFNDLTAKLVESQYALVGKPLGEVFEIRDENDVLLDLENNKPVNPIRRRDLTIKLADGSVMKTELDISPYTVNQKDTGFIIIIRDITKEKTLEEQQEEFISVASHELRTPLATAEANISSIMASSQAPKDKNLREMLNQAHRNIVFLSDIINDLTTLSEAAKDIIEVDIKPLEPKEIITQVQEEFIKQADAKGIKLEIDMADDIPTILTSPYRVRQILQNFLLNALKYSSEGTITLRAEAAPKKEGILFSVRDEGIGISVPDQKKLFTKFFRSEDYRTRESGGTGLGLYISAQLAERLGGKVWCESKLNKGSTFFLQLPLKLKGKPKK